MLHVQIDTYPLRHLDSSLFDWGEFQAIFQLKISCNVPSQGSEARYTSVSIDHSISCQGDWRLSKLLHDQIREARWWYLIGNGKKKVFKCLPIWYMYARIEKYLLHLFSFFKRWFSGIYIRSIGFVLWNDSWHNYKTIFPWPQILQLGSMLLNTGLEYPFFLPCQFSYNEPKVCVLY